MASNSKKTPAKAKAHAKAAPKAPPAAKEVAPDRTKLAKGAENFVNIPLDNVKFKKGFNPRTELGDYAELKRSIVANRLLHPIVVTPTAPGADTYYVIAGARRLTIFRELGKAVIPATIRSDVDIDSREARGLAMAENSPEGRTNLLPIDEAKAFQRFFDEDKHITPAQIGAFCGCSGQHVKHVIKLLDLPEAIQVKVNKNELSKQAGIAVADVPEEYRDRVAKLVTPKMTEGDIRKLANDIRRDESAKKPAPAKAKEGSKPSKADKRSDHNRPLGHVAEGTVVWRSKEDVRKRITIAGLRALNACDDSDKVIDEAKWLANAHQCAALLWAAGEIERIDVEAKDFRDALADIKKRAKPIDEKDEKKAEAAK